MLNQIAIGLLVTLDTQTRTLTRVSDGQSVTLPASACLCLQALAEANGEVLSQEQLMDIGWRSAGVEVTDNSVRVMINKLRRALNDLELQDEVTLLAVTRSGYRLLVRENTSVAPAFSEPEPHAASTAPSAHHTPALRSPRQANWRKRLQVLFCGVLAGLVVGLALTYLFVVTPTKVDFVHWYGPGIPPDTEVRVQKDRRKNEALIEATLATYTRYVREQRSGEKPARVLYITLGLNKNLEHQGVIACQQTFQESGNDCESFYFRIY